MSMSAPFTPPGDAKLECFESTTSPLRHNASAKTPPPSFSSVFHPPSPPISPESRPSDDKLRIEAVISLRDPELFSDREASVPISKTAPLFSAGSDVSSEDHIGTLLPSTESDHNQADRLQAVYIVQRVVDTYNANARAYMRRELDLLCSYPSLVSRPAPVSAAKRALGHEMYITKRSRTPRRSFGANEKPRPRVSRPPRSDAAHNYREGTDEIHHRRPPAMVHRDDTDYGSLPDYSPPASTLPHGGKSLKAEWRGHPLDLSSDADRQHMHDAEVALAATLRLSCAQYLCSKRRIFQSRLECMRNGKEFRKTTAQQACKIDVNKASKLWTAFDKVGWFEPKHMRAFV